MQKYNMQNDMERILISESEIAKRIEEMAKTIMADMESEEYPLFVCILKGSVFFFSDLMREINMPVEFDFMAISSYGSSSKTTGEVKMVKDLNYSVEGKSVIIVEDIVDSGLTLRYLKNLLLARGAKSVKIATLLDKPEGRRVEMEADYVGFEIENFFVVGYGLDYSEKYRNLKDVCVLKPEVYTK